MIREPDKSSIFAVLDLPQLLRDLRDETEVTLWETLALHLLTFGTMLEYLLLTGDFAMSVNALLPYLADRRYSGDGHFSTPPPLPFCPSLLTFACAAYRTT